MGLLIAAGCGSFATRSAAPLAPPHTAFIDSVMVGAIAATGASAKPAPPRDRAITIEATSPKLAVSSTVDRGALPIARDDVPIAHPVEPLAPPAANPPPAAG